MKKIILILASTLLTSALGYALEVGQPAPCVVLDHVKGQTESTHCIRDSELEAKPVFIEFFSITCSDCQKNLPQIKKLAQNLEGKATIRLVSIDRNEQAVRDYIKANNINLEVAFDSERLARKAYKVVVTPTLYLLDQSNTVIEKHTGILSDADLSDLSRIAEGL